MTNEIYLLRHCHIESHGKMVGSSDLELSETGICQAHELQEKLKDISFKKVFASKLQRTIKTAQIITRNMLEVHGILEFNEVNLGEWEGKPRELIKEKYSDLWLERGNNLELIAPPRGENMKMLQNRVLPKFLKIIKENYDFPILIVAHQAVNRAILTHFLNIPINQMLNIAQDYGHINHFEYTNGQINFLG